MNKELSEVRRSDTNAVEIRREQLCKDGKVSTCPRSKMITKGFTHAFLNAKNSVPGYEETLGVKKEPKEATSQSSRLDSMQAPADMIDEALI